jgi:hypothetical protein
MPATGVLINGAASGLPKLVRTSTMKSGISHRPDNIGLRVATEIVRNREHQRL